MVEVFRTNVKNSADANMLIDEIHNVFVNCKANFDLEDCDKILRVKWINGAIDSSVVIDVLRKHGFKAEVLPDEIKRLAS